MMESRVTIYTSAHWLGQEWPAEISGRYTPGFGGFTRWDPPEPAEYIIDWVEIFLPNGKRILAHNMGWDVVWSMFDYDK
ncbi:MAG: hypothetical protein D6816_16260, partial [Bacteroidetes bacterium]